MAEDDSSSSSSDDSSSTMSTAGESKLVLSADTTVNPNGGYILAAVGGVYNQFVAPGPPPSSADLLRVRFCFGNIFFSRLLIAIFVLALA